MDNGTADSSGRVAERKRHSALVGFFIRLVREKPLGTVGAVITLLMLFTGIFADLLVPYGVNETHLADALLAPSAQYWLGTDYLGRDLLTRVIYGARVSTIVGLTASTIATIMIVIIGGLSGYIGGKFDLILQRFIDAWLGFPQIIILMIMITLVTPSMTSIIIAIGITVGIGGSRIARGVVISAKENVYITAATAIGCSPSRILIRHILPNIMAPILVVFTTQVPMMVMWEATLSFLGFGIPPPTPSWGGMLTGAGRRYMFQSPWPVIWPGLALAIFVYGINIFGDAARDLLDPRLKGGVGRYGMKVKKEATVKSEPGAPGGLTKQ